MYVRKYQQKARNAPSRWLGWLELILTYWHKITTGVANCEAQDQ